ncbi:MAG: CdaR family protein [Dehalobacterium sp.]
MKNLTRINNLVYKIVAIVLAVLLWLYVNNQENPVTDQIFTVPLEVRGLEQKLTISDRPSFVKVRVQGQRKILDDLTARDLQAFLEMSGLDVGQHIVEVHVSVPEGTQLVSVTPSNANLNIEALTTAQYTVNVSYSDNTPAEGYLALKPVLTPTQVLLSGPEDKLKEVDLVYVEVDLGEYSFNYHQKLPIKVEDDKGNLLLDWINVTPSQVDVLVPIVNELPSKTVPVKVPVSGTPGEGYGVSRLAVEPEVLTVMGELQAINGLESLTTEPVNIEGAVQDVVKQVDIILPKGVTLNREVSVTAVVRIENTRDKSFTALPVIAKNIPEGLTAEFSEPTVDLTVVGVESLMERMMGADAAINVDLKDLPAGEHQVPIQVDLPQGISLKEVTPEEITVILK